jgi:hypothetical protein
VLRKTMSVTVYSHQNELCKSALQSKTNKFLFLNKRQHGCSSDKAGATPLRPLSVKRKIDSTISSFDRFGRVTTLGFHLVITS